MECPYCGHELDLVDYFGRYISHFGSWHVLGDIYKCPNEDCEFHGTNFYVYRGDSEVHEGYPC